MSANIDAKRLETILVRFFSVGRGRLGRLGRWVGQFGLMLAGVLVSLIVRENYPFSHYPMYSKFDPYTYYLYATDESGEVLLFREQFGYSAIRLKKVFTTKLKAVKKASESKTLSKNDCFHIAGEETLWQYHRQRRPKVENPVQYRGLKLVRTDIKLGTGKVEEQVAVIAEIEVAATQP